jgi:hypothetical protein
MAKKQAIQVGGRKEAQLAIVEESVVPQQSPQEQVYTPDDDAEYQRYSELLQGFFGKLTRWNNILMTVGFQWYKPTVKNEQGDPGGQIRGGFSVLRSDSGFSISPSSSDSAYVDVKHDSPNKVLEVGYDSYTKNYSRDFRTEQLDYSHIFIRPGRLAGEKFFTDLEGKPIRDVWIIAEDKGSLAGLTISANYPFSQKSHAPSIAEYQINRHTQTLTIKGGVNEEMMPIPYQIHLLDTIDRLIPDPTVTPQPERRAKQELGSPMQLPAPARRTRPPGR